MCSVAPTLGWWNTVNWCGSGWELCTRMGLFHGYGSSRSCNPWRTYRCMTSCTSFRSDQIQYHQNSTLVMVKFGCLVNILTLLVGCLVGSVLRVYFYGTQGGQPLAFVYLWYKYNEYNQNTYFCSETAKMFQIIAYKKHKNVTA